MSGTFMYFGFGSNMLAKRIHINTSAIFKGVGFLKDFRLDFSRHSELWNGATATIVATKGSNVWGAIWEIDNSNMDNLDKQEGVSANIYKVLNENIETATGEIISCRLYQQVNPLDTDPEKRKPSVTYLNTIIKGAEECNLPSDYLQFLKAFPNNGQEAAAEIRDKLNL